jgi:hypothetical protein
MKIYKRVFMSLKLGSFRKEHGLKLILEQVAEEYTWSEDRGSDGKQKRMEFEAL